MTLFWIIAGGMVAVALAILLPPILRTQRRASSADRDALNVAVIRQHLAELEADLASGKIGEAEFQEARQDLERELLSDVTGDGATDRPAATGRGRWAAPAIAVAIPLLSLGLYQFLGASDLIPQFQGRETATATETGQPDMHSVEQMVEQLAERLRAEPDNLEGWLMLARSYVFMQRFSDAVGAYANANRLAGDTNAALLVDYADAVAMASNRKLTGMPAELLRKALAIDPNNLKGLWLTGHLYYQQEDYARAIEYFERVAAELPADSENGRAVAEQLRQARLRAGAPDTAPAEPSAPTSAATAGKSVKVEVTLDPALQNQVSPEDTLFIFARAVQGPRMPLAIVRRQAKDLPFTVTLDDSLAMSPAMSMSKFDEVTVGARISKSGNAMTQSGDLSGAVSPVRLGSDETIRITIDQREP